MNQAVMLSEAKHIWSISIASGFQNLIRDLRFAQNDIIRWHSFVFHSASDTDALRVDRPRRN
jgi:hypothetical protein